MRVRRKRRKEDSFKRLQDGTGAMLRLFAGCLGAHCVCYCGVFGSCRICDMPRYSGKAGDRNRHEKFILVGALLLYER